MPESEFPESAGRKRVAPPSLIDPNQRYSLAEVDAALRQSHMTTFEDIQEGRLKVIRDGRRVYVLGKEIIRRSKICR